jgi:hypothetical protein
MEAHDMTLTINDGLGGGARSAFSIFSVPLPACFEKPSAGQKVPLLPIPRNSREAF